jgi:secreted protein with Ig-like and vWFA domain
VESFLSRGDSTFFYENVDFFIFYFGNNKSIIVSLQSLSEKSFEVSKTKLVISVLGIDYRMFYDFKSSFADYYKVLSYLSC